MRIFANEKIEGKSNFPSIPLTTFHHEKSILVFYIKRIDILKKSVMKMFES